MLKKLLNLFSIKVEIWRLRGYDTFAGESFHIPGKFFSKNAAERAARKYLKKLEKTQPVHISGGQKGIQDQVYIIRPDGSIYRYRLEDDRISI